MIDASVVESDQDTKKSTPTRGSRGKKRKPGWEAPTSWSPVRDFSYDSQSVQAKPAVNKNFDQGDKVEQAGNYLLNLVGMLD